MAARIGEVAAVWANPLVVRDIRVRMRGPRAYWHLSLYLGLLSLLALAGYANATISGHYDQATGSIVHSSSAAEVQQQLQVLYYYIFFTLAALVCFIAPALTAASITTERQRLTLDLLVTTPLTSSELLVGKLVASVAFLMLLLAMSLPASTLCVILGGATLGDVFRIYVLLLMDGLLLSAIGLYYSGTSKNSMNAIISTYVSVAIALWISSSALPFMFMSHGAPGTPTGNPIFAVAALNPFVAVMDRGGSFAITGLAFPTWALTAFIAFVTIRLIVTGTTYRMGSYGTDALGSLRRQVLFISFLGMFLTAYGLLYTPGAGPFTGGRMVVGAGPAGALFDKLLQMEYMMIGAMAIAGLFYPNLFTPDMPEDAAPGQAVDGAYDVKRAFRPSHAGALPYYHAWIAALVAGVLAAAFLTGMLSWPLLGRVLLTAFYISGLGFLGWALARRMSTVVAGVAGARALTFGAQIVIVAIPILALVFSRQVDNPVESLWAPFWVFYPILKTKPMEATWALAYTGLILHLIGVLVFPFWRKVVPAGARYWGAPVAG